jgi:hypothetical protein
LAKVALRLTHTAGSEQLDIELECFIFPLQGFLLRRWICLADESNIARGAPKYSDVASGRIVFIQRL